MEFEGTTFAGYRIERKLGAGGMGTVYLAQHPRLPRKDALKILADGNDRDSGFRTRFLQEAEVAARLDHPNLVTIRDRGEDRGRLWIAMQYVDGVDLAELIRRRRLGLDRVAHIIGEAAQGLDEIHRVGLLHRDVKPANILVAAQSVGPERVFLTDFGIARPATDPTLRADSGGLTGTLAYAAPEQISSGRVDHRADVYALGCTLYHLLTGSPPFPRENLAAVMYAHLHEPPPRPTDRNPSVPRGFDAVVATAMAKKPADRYTGCGELAAAVRAVLAGGVAPQPRRVVLRRRRRIALGAMAVVLAVVLAATYFLVRPEPATPAAGAHAPVTGTTEPTEWGDLGFVALAFPDLLPPLPRGAGYQELSTCTANSSQGMSIAFKLPTGSIAEVMCMGNLDPVWAVMITCRIDRSPIPPGTPLALVEGDEIWSRPSGTGHLFWGRDIFDSDGYLMDDREVGILEVYFDDPSRNFCRITVIGYASTGTDLRSKWWLDAPL